MSVAIYFDLGRTNRMFLPQATATDSINKQNRCKRRDLSESLVLQNTQNETNQKLKKKQASAAGLSAT